MFVQHRARYVVCSVVVVAAAVLLLGAFARHSFRWLVCLGQLTFDPQWSAAGLRVASRAGASQTRL